MLGLVLLTALVSGPALAASKEVPLDCLTDGDGLHKVGPVEGQINPDDAQRPVSCVTSDGRADYSLRTVLEPTSDLGTD